MTDQTIERDGTAVAPVPMPEYLAIKALSSGMCQTLLTASPLHAWLDSPWNPTREDDSNKASDIGTIAHDVLLEGGTGLIERIDPNDYQAEKTGAIPVGWTNKAIRAARDAARAAGKIPLFPADCDAVSAMVESAKDFLEHSELKGVFDSGKAELTVQWDDCNLYSPGPGKPIEKLNVVPCKARPDWLNDGVCLHLKTTKRSVNPPSFERLAINMGYDISVAFYARGIERERHVILAIEQNPPYACKLFSLSNAQWDISSRRVDRAINIWRECRRRGEYPAYSGEVHLIEPTSWQLAQAEQDAYDDEKLTDEELKGGIPG